MKHHETFGSFWQKTETREVWNTKKMNTWHDYMIVEITFHRTYQVISPTSASSAPLQVHLLPMQRWWLLHSRAHHVLLHRLEDTVPFAMDRMSSPQTPWISEWWRSKGCLDIDVKELPSDRSEWIRNKMFPNFGHCMNPSKEDYVYIYIHVCLCTIWVVHNCRNLFQVYKNHLLIRDNIPIIWWFQVAVV